MSMVDIVVNSYWLATFGAKNEQMLLVIFATLG